MAEEKDKKDLENLISSLTSDLKQRATFTNKLEKLLENQSDSFSQLLGLVLRVYGDEGNVQSVQTKLSNLARSEQTTLKQELRELGSLLGVIPPIVKPYLKQEELEKVFPKEKAEEIAKKVKNFYDQLFDPEILKVVLTRSKGEIRESANIAVKTFVDFISGLREDFLSLERASRITLIKSLNEQKSIQPYFLMQKGFLKEGEFREFLPIQEQVKTYFTAFSAFREQYEEIQKTYKNFSLFSPFNIFNYGEISRSLRNEALKNIFNTLSNQRIIFSEEINRINKELSSKEPKTEEEIAKLKEQRTLLTKEFFETVNKEIAIRKELNKELENAINQIKSFSIKSTDLLFSTTRNPFVDIFTSAIRTGLQVGSSVGSATQNIFSRVLPPTQVNIPNQRRTTQQQPPTTTTTQQQRRLPNQTIFSTRNLFRGGLIGLGTSLLTEQLFGDGIQRQDIPRILGGTIGGILGSLVPIPYLNIGTSILGSYLGANLGSFLGEKFQNQTKEEQIKQEKNLAENLKNLNLSSINLNEAFLGLNTGALSLSNSFANLGKSLPNIFTPDFLSRGAGLVTGVGAGLLAGLTDFFLSSLNKSYDIFYQNFVQSRLIPQGIRERLGNLSDIAGAFVAGGRFPILGQGFTREELLGTAGRLNALIPLQNDLNKFRENVFRAAESANLFGTSIADTTNLIATSTKALTNIDFAKQLAFSLTGDYSAFSKAFSEAILQTSTSLAIRQFANPSAFAFSFGLFQNMFRMSPNQNLAQLALYNPEVIQNTFNTFNEFIRSGLTNPVAGGILLRAGLTPREMLMGATPENLERIIPSLMAQFGLYSQYVGGEFTAQSRNYLLPFVQQALGLTNISPDIFEDVLKGFASGRSLEASERLSRILAQPSPTGRPPDRQFAEQLDTLNVSFQVLTEIMQQNIGAIRDLNQAILGLTITVLDLGAKNASDIVDLIGKSSVGLMGDIGNERYREILNQIRQKENLVRSTANIVQQRNEQNNMSLGTQNQMPEIRVSGSSGNYVIFVEGKSTVIDVKELGEIIKKMKK